EGASPSKKSRRALTISNSRWPPRPGTSRPSWKAKLLKQNKSKRIWPRIVRIQTNRDDGPQLRAIPGLTLNRLDLAILMPARRLDFQHHGGNFCVKAGKYFRNCSTQATFYTLHRGECVVVVRA